MEAQDRLLALEDPDIDRALADNPSLAYAIERRLRLRRPTVLASAAAYNADHHSRALQSGDPDLAAAALLDRRTTRWSRPLPPTVWATAWRTVRLAGGAERVREVLTALAVAADAGTLRSTAGAAQADEIHAASPIAASPFRPANRAEHARDAFLALSTDATLDDATRQIAEACAEPDPEPCLITAEDRVIGTAAFLRRLSTVRERTDRRLADQILGEPYQVDWSLVSAAVLGGRLPKMATRMLLHHPACPPDVGYVLLHGRPAPRHLKQNPHTPPPKPSARPLPHHPSPYAPPPPDPGPLNAADPLAVLATTAVGTALTIEHIWSAIELRLLTADDAVQAVRPANTVASYAGQTSSFAACTLRPGSGQARLNAAAQTYLAHWARTHTPAPGFWRNINALLRVWPGTLPTLLAAATDGPGEPS
ncbi:MAG: hypothetical protein HOV83_27250 [Catenulispora sp.]|nr:hypothetical protein [Catenulispora sp.]